MERSVEIKIKEHTYALVYTVGVMFDAMEHFDDASIIEAINMPRKQGLENLLWLASAMSAAGEALRQENGHDAQLIIKPDTFFKGLLPFEFVELKTAVLKAIKLGYIRDIKEGEIDLVLADLQKKS